MNNNNLKIVQYYYYDNFNDYFDNIMIYRQRFSKTAYY